MSRLRSGLKRLEEKDKRVKYIRALERFVKSAIAVLKREDFDEELFKVRMQKNYQVVAKVEPVVLDSGYTKALEMFVNSVLHVLKNPQDDFRQNLLKEANALEKLKNNYSYKKDKHKNSGYDGW